MTSTVVRLTPHDRFGLDAVRRERMRRLVQALFGQRRKQLQKSLRGLAGGTPARDAVARVGAVSGLDLERRPETLSPDEFLALDAALEKTGLFHTGMRFPT